MSQFLRLRLCLLLGLFWCTRLFSADVEHRPDANRLSYLEDASPFYPNLGFPRLTTPQWVGESNVDAVVILAIDDMGPPPKYEAMLRPILDRLKRIDGRAPVSIMCTTVDPAAPQLQTWLREGLSLEVHTLTHPCPLLAQSNFVAAAETYHGGVEFLHRIAGNQPVAFRMPCCDSINSPSPRFYAEIFNQTNWAGQFLSADSSVMNILTAADSSLRREWVIDKDGRDKFRKYAPFASFTTTIENYPYPYVIGRLCWEFPAMVPSDWEAQHLHGTNNPVTVADWKAALDSTVAKQGTFTFVFHPHGWIRAEQMVEFIDYADSQYGRRIKFLTFGEAEARIREQLLAGHALRRTDGGDNGVRLLDLDGDGFMDVVIANPEALLTRLWLPANRQWREFPFPTLAVQRGAEGALQSAGLKIGIIHRDGYPSVLASERKKGAWHFDGKGWQTQTALWRGLDFDGRSVVTVENGRDRGVRLRDVDQDGRCELIVGNDTSNGVFGWSDEEESWKRLPFGLPEGVAIVDPNGSDAGLRFVDVNEDGYDDVLFSDARHYSLHLFVPKLFLGFQAGWTREVITGQRGDSLGEIPMLARDGPHRNNGAWFRARNLWVQNEDTAGLPECVDRRSYDSLLGGLSPKPKSPDESLACLRARPGFKVELVACEPLVKDPIAFEWGADGRLWVVEMGDYPLGLDGHGQGGGIVRFLEDTNRDGRYDKSTVFLDHLNFPTGVMPWRNGVLVSAAPEIFYAEDTDGDGQADVKVTLLKGFTEGNQQHRVNGFEYGLDNWVYGANGDSGGEIVLAGVVPGPKLSSSAHRSDAVSELRGHDFRFRPDDGLFETVSGQTQYGRHRDDWGNWYGNNNPAWLWHVFLPEVYLARNPHLPVRTVKRYLANYPNSTRVFPVSRTMQRFNDIAMVNHVTSANSAAPYRDDLFGPDFTNSVFISEPVHNAVHREVLEADGISFSSHRAADEKEREFLASTDNWFRPTMLKTGPDGALYCADMYRMVLEHPEWIPIDSQQHLDLRAGSDLGRIYRISPDGSPRRPLRRLDTVPAAGLVDYLDSPNGWTRDTAQRLLAHLGDRSIVPKLVEKVADGASPKTRLQALCTLDGMGQLSPSILLRALSDREAAVREHAVRLSEPWLAGSLEGSRQVGGLGDLKERLLTLVDDPAIRVRYQLAFTLGAWVEKPAAIALARLGTKDEAEPLIEQAVLSSAVPHTRLMLEVILRDFHDHPPIHLLKELLSLAVILEDRAALAGTFQQLGLRHDQSYALWQFAALSGLLDGVERRYQSLEAYREMATGDLRVALDSLTGLFEAARQLVVDSRAADEERTLVVALLGRGMSHRDEDRKLLADLLRPQVPLSLQHAAAGSLGRLREDGVGALLLQGWRTYEPSVRTELLGVLISRPAWAEQLLVAIEQGIVPAAQVTASIQQKLLGSSHETVRVHAEKLFSVTANRQELLKTYRSVLELEGDRGKGAALFRQHSTPCHRLHDEGSNVGPDLGALANKSGQTLLIALLDPNQAVESRYISYSATTTSDRELSGIIVSETPGSITFRSAGGLEETVLRNELKDLTSSGLSLMPEGFEKVMSKEDLADLIAFVTSPN